MLRIPHLLASLALMGTAGAPLAGAQTDIGNMTPAERSAFGAEVRAYLLENPEVIMEAIQILEERRMQAAATADRELVAENAEELFDDGYSYVAGNPEGDVTVVEFLDYRCPYCKRAHPEVEAMLERDPNVRLVVKELPILGPASLTAARVALAALELDRDKFPALHDALMTHEGELPEPAIYRMAGQAGYDIAALKKAAAAEAITERLRQNLELATRLRIEGTPGFVIGEEVVRGYVSADELLAAVDEQRERASN